MEARTSGSHTSYFYSGSRTWIYRGYPRARYHFQGDRQGHAADYPDRLRVDLEENGGRLRELGDLFDGDIWGYTEKKS